MMYCQSELVEDFVRRIGLRQAQTDKCSPFVISSANQKFSQSDVSCPA